MARALSPADILRAWERGSARHPVDRALALLWTAEPDRDAESLLAMSVEERDHRLLALRRDTFGDRLDCRITCPACAGALELALSADTLLDSASEQGVSSLQADPLSVARDGYVVRLRRLDSRDLAAAARCADLETAEGTLLEQSVASADLAGESVPAAALPAAVRDAVAERLAAEAGAADIGLDLACPACGHRWEAVLDIAGFLWTEIESEARHLLHEVAALARRYGWREADILAMSPLRRRAYLDLEAAG